MTKTTYQIGEAIGAPKHGFIPVDKRTTREYDGEGKRFAITEYIKAHPGEVLKQQAVAEKIGIPLESISRHIRVLLKKGKISRERVGLSYRYWPGKIPTRAHGQVETIKAAAPISRATYEAMDAEAWAFIRGSVTLTPHELGIRTKGMVEFLDHIKSKSPEGQGNGSEI